MSLKEIEDMTGVSASTIYRRIRKRKENNAAYLNKIDESMNQLKQGKVVIKTMDELEEMSK
jgi:transposase